ncbi:HIT domain-containing protein [Caulobacter segnis]|uniref:Histidine triad (HIT) protein n=2 Tax=Caulobacter segnis TaxID=88688 RepID=D5VHY8_CAUST|nr:alpha/beta fold hydrolase [Caulobacter segnis]ADG09241.1 histidine triad (HIT) protein [Caulobacter segnis ATCC 21756]AVQ04304.1 HIT domain-containing protein [Caulobacter segnis]
MHRLAAALTALLLAFASPALAELKAPPTPRAVVADPPRDNAHPAGLDAFQIDVQGAKINGLIYLAAGDKPHPTMLFLHGFPGNETNIDLMQAVRRAGWNVLKINYRGSWGSGGAFSFAHARTDAEAAVDFLTAPANIAKYRIDPRRIVVAGHSMGGFMAASASAARSSAVAGTVLIDAWNIGADPRFTTLDPKVLAEEMRPDTAPLAGTSPEALIAEVGRDRAKLDLVALSRTIAERPVLMIGAERGIGQMTTALAKAARDAHPNTVVEAQYPTDHSFSDSRIALESEVLRWLARFDPTITPAGARIPLTAAYDETNPFAKILRGELPAYKVYEDADVLAFMDRAPMEPGHVLVISKTSKARTILEMDPKDLAKVMAVVQRVGRAEVEALGLEGFMIIQNNGVGQSVPHLHVHVIPRIAGKPAYLAENAPADPKDLEAMAARIKAAMK